ncbi:hypothetical protein PLESTB_001622500 [Pleodorina starrii]|uniref:Uncharacterized protein n=1 Tax=Pleodorina starrii TaxID=330485 RepID=A0A9W6BYD1_9CHLO|nr:hypothetical protein PLESTM_002041100 [Pleodorina starrii]GLC60518.1 hypothetical protein PLESTB_001622500 [Pleodorina starrii]GLC76624.1 hypothetical protein PLESTF_001807000 [Pleodorina starrii]
MRAKILVVPVYQKHWLYHVWSETTAAEAAERPVHWTLGTSLHEKAALFGKELSYKVNAAAAKQWKSVQAAEEGTFKNRLYRLAQWVLSQEDPRETFLKSVPRGATSLEIIHPCGLRERLVRRRLRRMALTQEAFHNRRILGWALATLPQLPLVITPFPNVTLYFTAYKMMSHYQALQGCRTLRSAFERYDKEEAARRREASARGLLGGLAGLLPLPRRHGCGACDGAEGVVGKTCCSGGGSNCSHKGSSVSGPFAAGTGSAAPPLPEFRCCKALDKAVRPLERWQSPLSDEGAARLEQIFHPKPKPKTQSKAIAGRGKDGGGQGEGQGEGEGAGGDTGAGQLPELVTRLRRQVQGNKQ